MCAGLPTGGEQLKDSVYKLRIQTEEVFSDTSMCLAALYALECCLETSASPQWISEVCLLSDVAGAGEHCGTRPRWRHARAAREARPFIPLLVVCAESAARLCAAVCLCNCRQSDKLTVSLAVRLSHPLAAYSPAQLLERSNSTVACPHQATAQHPILLSP